MTTPDTSIASRELKPDKCEWNPLYSHPSYGGAVQGDCHRYATIRAGAGKNNFHVCEICAVLPRFKRLKKTPLRSGTL